MKLTSFTPHEGVYIEHIKKFEKHNMPVQHYHDSYEIYLQLDGTRYLFWDGVCYILKRGDMAVLKPLEIHYAESREVDYYERYVVNFKEKDLGNILSAAERKMLFEKLIPGVVHLSPKDADALTARMKLLEEYMNRRGAFSKTLVESALLQLIVKAAECTDEKFMLQSNKDSQIAEALKYIAGHYTEKISIEELSDAAHMSKYYFCRKFRETTGASAIEYLNNVRLAMAHNMLINTSMAIDEISIASGFGSAVNLTRVFKKVYGCSPREFKKKNMK